MKKLEFYFLFLLIPLFSQAQTKYIDESIVEGYYLFLTYNELPFIANELIYMYKKDSTIIRKYYFSKYERQFYSSNKVGSLYLYDIAAKALIDSLLYYKNKDNEYLIGKMIDDIGYSIPKMDGINWEEVFACCENCQFAEFPGEIYFYVKSSLIYMSENEIKTMIEYDDGSQWRDVIGCMEYGDVFEGIVSDYSGSIEIDRRIISYLINKWSPCQIPEVQQLVKILKKIVPMNYKDTWYEAISGKWRGKFGDKIIEMSINANEFEISGFSKFEGQLDEKRIVFYGDEYQQVSGPFVSFIVMEQPIGNEWNGKFYCKLVRNTGKLEGVWTSYNRKLKREFVLDQVKE